MRCDKTSRQCGLNDSPVCRQREANWHEAHNAVKLLFHI